MQQVLILTKDHVPVRWASVHDAALYVAKDLVIHSFGDEIVLYGGHNRNGNISKLEFHSILVVNGNINYKKYKFKPSLSNRALYKRDLYTCAYCGNVFISAELSRDHVMPVSKKGKNTWDNTVTACKPCNRRKGDKLINEFEPLLFQPYHPTKAEELLMFSRKDEVTAEQIKLLVSHIKNNSRVKQEWESWLTELNCQ